MLRQVSLIEHTECLKRRLYYKFVGVVQLACDGDRVRGDCRLFDLAECLKRRISHVIVRVPQQLDNHAHEGGKWPCVEFVHSIECTGAFPCVSTWTGCVEYETRDCIGVVCDGFRIECCQRVERSVANVLLCVTGHISKNGCERRISLQLPQLANNLFDRILGSVKHPGVGKVASSMK